jgi:hypothetical protein
MNRSIYNLLVLSLAALACSAQTWSERNTTLGHVNARYWQSLSITSKADFLIGFVDGYSEALPSGIPWDLRKIVGEDKVAAATKAIESSRSLAWYFPDKMSYGELMKGIDQLYENPENIRLPIRDALEVFTRKANGATQAQIDDVLAARRKSVHDVEELMKKSDKQDK